MSATVRELWLENAGRSKHGFCDECRSAAYVARQPNCRKWQCVACFTRRPTGSPAFRRIVRRVRRAERQPTSTAPPAAGAHEQQTRLEGAAA